MDEIREHWRQSAVTHGRSLEATTRTWTAKLLEVDALARRITSLVGGSTTKGAVLEVGCGNGVNCLELADRLPNLTFDGVDYVADMVAAAEENREASQHADRLRFFVGDVLRIGEHTSLAQEYDVVFTDRCLINLDTPAAQKAGISALAAKVKPEGHLVMIENSTTTYGEQNRCRELLGLEPRTPASFNLFFDEAEILPHIAAAGLELIDVEDFSSLHDLMLYVLVPAANGGEVDYGHPLVELATRLSVGAVAATPSPFGSFGQNRLYCCRKPSASRTG